MAMISRNRQRWTTSEDQKLIDMYVRSKTYAHMASELQRTEDAVKARFVKIYLVKYLYDKKKSYVAQKDNLCRFYKLQEDDLVRYLKYAGIKVHELMQQLSDIEENQEDADIIVNQNIANILQSISRKISIIGSAFMLFTAYTAIMHGIKVYLECK
jgi:hypothetical protein